MKFMTHTYTITGMTCNGCVAKAKNELLKLGDITEATVQLTSPQATINMQKHIPLEVLQTALHKAGNYTISETGNGRQHQAEDDAKTSWFSTYKPILLIGAYITGITLLIEFQKDSFDWQVWMPQFMAGFFLVFSFFKLLNLKAFAESYASYDIIAKRWLDWGYLYAFIELGLGLAFLLDVEPLLTNAITFLVMGISIVGVIQSVLGKRKIQCACLGAVFNLPMSTVTIIEDALMIAMSGLMIFTMF
jgi:copper chaperone CopZ